MINIPLVTIGIPVYNESNYLAETIESALNQTYANVRIIISDNKSTDESLEIAKSYSSNNQRINLIEQKENIGALENFKYVLKKANSKYFIWLGGHDILNQDYITKAVEVLENNKNIVMVYPISRLMSKNGFLLEIEGSNIDSMDLSFEERLCKVANNLYSGIAIHGVFRTEIAKILPFKKTIGTDLLMIFATSTFGNIKELNYEGIYRRIIRDETPEEIKRRHSDHKLYNANDANPYALLVLNHYLVLIKRLNPLKLKRNINIFKRLKIIFSSKFGLRTKHILMALFKL